MRFPINTTKLYCYSIIIFLVCYHRNIKFKGPYTINSEQRTIHHTYLDTIGRPVVVVNKDNLVEQHIADFEVQWTLLHGIINYCGFLVEL